VHPSREDMHILELGIFHVLFEHLPIGRTRGAGVRHHEGQFEHLGAGIATGRIAHHCPDDVGHAVNRLIHQFGWRTAKLHGGIALHLDATVAVRFDLVGPDIQYKFRHIGLRRQELVKAQCHFLRERGHGTKAQRKGRGPRQTKESGSCDSHSVSLPVRRCG
jgi:hypothetical protein